jgi:DNA-binding CsgD family transcriptional regulator
MSIAEVEYRHALEAIARAPFDASQWLQTIVPALTKAANGYGAQLFGVTPTGGMQFNFTQGISEEVTREWELRGGTTERVNPRARIFAQAPCTVHSDADLGRPEEYRTEFFQDFVYKHGCVDTRMVNLPRLDRTSICITVLKSRTTLAYDDRDHRSLTALIKPVADALRLRMLMDGDATRLVSGALDAVGKAAFVLNAYGRVIALTPRAENLVRHGKYFSVRNAILACRDRSAARSFEGAIQLACLRPGSALRPQASQIALRRSDEIALAEIAPLPAPHWSTRFGPAAIAFLRESPKADVSQLLRGLYGLTDSEARIAASLVDGKSIEEIAHARRARVGTVRAQLKSIYRKADVHRQAELVSLVRQLSP